MCTKLQEKCKIYTKYRIIHNIVAQHLGEKVMQGECFERPIFRHRYVGMDEEAIREEIERLQEELYTMQEELEFLRSNSNEAKREAAELQVKLERMVKTLDEKLTRLITSLDYEAPIKTQLEKVTKDYNEKIFELNNERWTKLYKLTIFNTILIGVAAMAICLLTIF